jgi:hypothetical protein
VPASWYEAAVLGILVRRRWREIRNAVRAAGPIGAAAALLGAAAALAGLGVLSFQAFDATARVAAAGGHAAFERGDPALLGPLAAAPRVYLWWREYVYWAAALGAAATAYAGHHLLYWRSDWPILTALPIPPASTHAATALDLAAALAVVPLAGSALAAPLYWARAWGPMWAALAQVWGVHALAACAAMALLPLAGASAAAGASTFKRFVSGNWAPPEFAPFFYAPAAVLAAAAFGGIVLGKASEDLCLRVAPARGLAVLAALAAAAAAALAAGRRWHVQAHARAVPLVREVALRMVSIEAQDQAPPWGAGLAALLPARLRPLFGRDLRQMNRAARGRYAVGGVAAGVFLLFALRTPVLPGWSVLGAAGLTAWLAAVALRLADPDLDVPWLARALPVGAGGLLPVRALLATFLAAHFALPAAGAVFLHGRRAEAAALALVPGVAAAIAVTLRRALAPMVARGVYYLAAGAAALGAVWRPSAGATVYLGAAALACLLAAAAGDGSPATRAVGAPHAAGAAGAQG